LFLISLVPKTGVQLAGEGGRDPDFLSWGHNSLQKHLVFISFV